MSPTVSVILPTYNRLHFLRAAIDSVLAQSFEDWELLVVDDGSAPEVGDYVESLGHASIRLLRRPHSGNPSVVRNAGIAQARGQFLAFLDSDDLWLPQKLSAQLALHRAHPRWRWSYTAVTRIDATGLVMPGEARARRPTPSGAIFADLLLLKVPMATPSVIVERRLLEEVGGFDESLRYFEDYDLFVRLSLRSDAGVLTEPQVLVRTHEEHYSADRIGVYEARHRLLAKYTAEAQRAGLKDAMERERLKNLADLARVSASGGKRGSAARLLWQARGAALHGRTWWRGSWYLLTECAPGWVRRPLRRWRAVRGASKQQV